MKRETILAYRVRVETFVFSIIGSLNFETRRFLCQILRKILIRTYSDLIVEIYSGALYTLGGGRIGTRLI